MKYLRIKTNSLLFWMALVILLSALPHLRAEAQGITFQTFYDNLSPYGEWIQIDNSYVWRPYEADPAWRPYTQGHWIMTDYGWTWASDYDWGWAPFHYGRWKHNYLYGWVWMPGYDWGPAWVSWRLSDNYFGWAPLGPDITVSADVGFDHGLDNNDWVFVPSRNFGNESINHYIVPGRENVTVINKTTYVNTVQKINNQYYVAGPQKSKVEKQTGRKVQVLKVKDSSQPGKGGTTGNALTVYHPAVKAEKTSMHASPRPKQFTPAVQALNAKQFAVQKGNSKQAPENRESQKDKNTSTTTQKSNHGTASPGTKQDMEHGQKKVIKSEQQNAHRATSEKKQANELPKKTTTIEPQKETGKPVEPAKVTTDQKPVVKNHSKDPKDNKP